MNKIKCKIYYKDGTIFEGDFYDSPHYNEDASKIIHREDGPAVDTVDGDKVWYQNGLLHREDGPAVEGVDGNKSWYLNGQQHREDGPAIEWANGIKYWFLNDEELETLSQEYLIRYMELTGETLAMLLVHPEEIVRNSVKKYKWNKK